MRIGKERCERKAYSNRVYPDRNRIRLRVNGASARSTACTGECLSHIFVQITT